MLSPATAFCFLLGGLIAANLAFLLVLSNLRLAWKILGVPALWGVWFGSSLALDPDWLRAGLPGHVLAVAIALFVVFGFPSVVFNYWRRTAPN